jgi:hypothetical protein
VTTYWKHEADAFAAELLRRYAHERAGMLGSGLDYEYVMAWMGGIAAATAISLWEDGLFYVARIHILLFGSVTGA